MSRSTRPAAFAILVAALGACEPNVAQDPPITGIRPVFDTVKGQIPLPNDILKDQTTGRLALPEADTDSPLTKEIKASINRLDGWLAASTITIPFDVELDRESLTYDSVLLFDVTRASENPPVITRLTEKDYYVLFNVGRTPATAPPYDVILKRKATAQGELPADFVRGGKYAAIVTDAVRTKDGKEFLDNPAYYFLRSKTPLAVNGKSTTILPDKDAAQLETTRVVYDKAFTAIEASGALERKRALAFTVFSVESGARAVFNPTAVGTVLPTPYDSGSTPAGAPLDVKPSITFDLPLNTSTIAAGTHLYRVDGGAFTDEAVTAEVATTPDAANHYKLTLSPAAPLRAETTYVALLTDTIKGTNGVPSEALSFFSLARNKNPLLDTSKNPPVLGSPFIDNTIDVLIFLGNDPKTATQAQWDDAYGLLIPNLDGLETLRKQYAPHFEAAAAKGIERLSVTALWQFTTGK